MNGTEPQDLARQIHELRLQVEALSRSRQLSRSSIPVTVDGGVIDVPLSAGVTRGIQAWDKSEYAKELAEELGLRTDELSEGVSQAAAQAGAAQSAADAAQSEAEAARSEAASKSAEAQAAAEAHASAVAEAARLAAVAEASGDATDKANAAAAAATAAAAEDATLKAAAAEAAAKAAAAAAQSTADQARSEAASAHAAAGDAATVAQQAQTTASGKNRTYRSTNAPAGVGSAAGDKWEQYDTLAAGGRLFATWAWTGAAWVSTALSETYLPLVNIGSGTYGTLTGARLAANAIDGMTITGALIRTAASGQRLQLDVNGLRAFDAAGAQTAQLLSASGGMQLNGGMSLRSPGSRYALTLNAQTGVGYAVYDTAEPYPRKNFALRGGSSSVSHEGDSSGKSFTSANLVSDSSGARLLLDSRAPTDPMPWGLGTLERTASRELHLRNSPGRVRIYGASQATNPDDHEPQIMLSGHAEPLRIVIKARDGIDLRGPVSFPDDSSPLPLPGVPARPPGGLGCAYEVRAGQVTIWINVSGTQAAGINDFWSGLDDALCPTRNVFGAVLFDQGFTATAFVRPNGTMGCANQSGGSRIGLQTTFTYPLKR